MSDLVHTVEIDRIVLRDLGVTPERAEYIRTLVEVELQRMLERENALDGLASGELSHLTMPTIHLAERSPEHHLASSLARNIAQTLNSVGSLPAIG